MNKLFESIDNLFDTDKIINEDFEDIKRDLGIEKGSDEEYQLDNIGDYTKQVYDIFTLNEIGPSNYESKLYDTVESSERADDIVAELRAQGVRAYYEERDEGEEVITPSNYVAGLMANNLNEGSKSELYTIRGEIRDDETGRLMLHTRNKETGSIGCANFFGNGADKVIVYEGKGDGSDDKEMGFDEFLANYDYVLADEDEKPFNTNESESLNELVQSNGELDSFESSYLQFYDDLVRALYRNNGYIHFPAREISSDELDALKKIILSKGGKDLGNDKYSNDGIIFELSSRTGLTMTFDDSAEYEVRPMGEFEELKESYAIVNYYDGEGNQHDKTFNGSTPKAVESKVKRLADRFEVINIHQASADLRDSEYLNSLGDGILRIDYNNSVFESEYPKDNNMIDFENASVDELKKWLDDNNDRNEHSDEFNTLWLEVYRMYLDKSKEKELVTEDNSSDKKYDIPDYAKECIESGLYDSRGMNLKSAMFEGNTLVVESRDELNDKVFDTIVKYINSYFKSYGIVADGGIEDDGDKVLAIDCYMTDEGYKEYLASSDEDDSITISGIIFKDKSDAKEWLDSKVSEYGNTYWFPAEDKYILNKLCDKFGNTYFWEAEKPEGKKLSEDVVDKQSILDDFNNFIKGKYGIYNNQDLADQLEHVSNEDVNEYFTDKFYDMETEDDLDNINSAEDIIRTEYSVPNGDDDDSIFEPTPEDIEEMKYWYNDDPREYWDRQTKESEELKESEGPSAVLYQVTYDNSHEYGFEPLSILDKMGKELSLSNYQEVANINYGKYTEATDDDSILETIFREGNTNQELRDENPNMRSVSVSDIVLLNGRYYYCDSFGWKDVTNRLEKES